MKFAITPCPNDTFSYWALITHKLENDFEFEFHDIETLNDLAQKGAYPVTKMSFAAYLKAADKYEILDAGAACGVGTGPVLVGKTSAVFSDSDDTVVAVPGLYTTAALLLRFYAGKVQKLEPMHFRKILDRVAEGKPDFGVLIHEGRFVFASRGLSLKCDLGEYWTTRTRGLPVPLGCICVRRDIAHAQKTRLEDAIRKSIETAFAAPEETYPYVRSMAQYLEDDVLKKHIYAFVNKYSLDISNIRDAFLENLAVCAK